MTGYVIALILLIILLFFYKRIIEYKRSLENMQTRFKDILNLDEEKENLERDIKSLKDEVHSQKQKTYLIAEIKEKLQNDIEELEETKEFYELGVYEPKYYYEFSEEYREKLNEINEEIKDVIKDKGAVICRTNWVVNNDKRKGQKMTNDNIKLMLRAFNGEVDAAIAKVKFSNIKTMENRIRKSFETINKLNEVNDCYITNKYLELRLEELHLNYEMSVKIQEEKEELRRIREEERENEKAQKEFEKAKLEAEKEEARAQKALEKAEEKLKKAHGIEVEKLNLQIEALKLQLETAHENKQKAISMAQITKSGYVYVISNIGSFGEDVYKIGMTRRLEPMDRVRELGDASVPFNFDVHAMIFSKNAPELEKLLHKEFYNQRLNKINDRREFFKVSLKRIEEVAQRYDADIKFTYEAEAEQYRRSLEIEKELNKKKKKQEKNKAERDYQEISETIKNI